ncbi:pentapeptide repeat-containing protein [Magnetospirillum sulfuroxidans]|nr:pentapeptide repeat-containing protein [Magnetospirillum sulfuroxidans]
MLQTGDIDWKAIRVLLFSGDDAFRFLVRQTFRKLNVREILSTSVSADATPMMGQAPDIALLDPDGDLAMAEAFLQRVRKADVEMPVLLVGASTDKPMLARLLPLGLEGIVPKRVSGHELTHRVGETLKKPKRMAVPVVQPVSPLDLPVVQASPPPPPPPAPAPPVPVTVGTVEIPACANPVLPAALAPAARSAGYVPPPSLVGRRGGGKLDDGDIVAGQASVKRDYALVDDEDDAARRLAEKRKARWLEELARQGKTPKKGKDVAALDVSAIVAAHALWLVSQGGDGQRAVFNTMDLGGADLSGAVLANASFRQTDLSDAYLAQSRLDGADFRYAVLAAAQISGANLGVAQLRHADLRLANLEGASLRGADLSGGRLAGAKLAGADFAGAVLMGCDLRAADLSKVENLTQGQVEKTLCDLETRLPPGLIRPVKDT